MFKNISKNGETILKRAFNKWGIFDLYKKLKIIIKPLIQKSFQYLKNDLQRFLKRKNLNK